MTWKHPGQPIKLLNILIVLMLLSACTSSGHKAPITDAAPVPSHKIKSHIVSPGETVYSIAWRYNINYKQLARANGLDSSYRIWPGQKLTLDVRGVSAQAPARAAKPVVKTTSKPKARSKNKSSTAKTVSRGNDATSSVSWIWPARGDVIRRFAQNGGLNKGIDIRGNMGEPVVAAADGEVVYSGSGLRGYGKLLIVKHSEKVLSAYAHNSALLVAEGEKVKAGQTIAKIGHSGTQVTKLHFEIRYDGTPVNPLKYLPKR